MYVGTFKEVQSETKYVVSRLEESNQLRQGAKFDGVSVSRDYRQTVLGSWNRDISDSAERG